ncbi:hypothetical protein [Photobacterium kishitanii]|uniref:PAS domain-containing protein n=1 Tax=Photobacterium kishitanii TaxID=318456 RepID=A0A2T3KBT1_9GAMM|nr:hypothetical protein [Photobacterium kishitanii]PSU92061.1 hypothetical protein C9J27_22635 [Photobacterium kishitanii]
MKKNEVYNFIDNYSEVAILMDDDGIVIHHNNNVFDYQFFEKPILGKNISKIFLEKSKLLGPLTYAQALNCQEKDRLCWLQQDTILNTEYYEDILYTTIRIIVALDREYLILLINKAQSFK